MPETRTLSPDELQELVKQGIDPTPYVGQKIPVYSDEELGHQQNQQVAQTNTSSGNGGAFQAGARAAVSGAIPAVASGASFMPGFTAGAGIGAMIPGADLTGISEAVGGLIGGAISSYGGGRLAGAAQNAVIPDSWKQQLSDDQTQHPIASAVGHLADLPLGGMSPSIGNVGSAIGAIPKALMGAPLTAAEKQAAMQVAAGGILGGGQEAVQEKMQGQPLSLSSIAEQAGIGSVFNKPNAIGQKLGFHAQNMDPDALSQQKLTGDLQQAPSTSGQRIDGETANVPPPNVSGVPDVSSTITGLPVNQGSILRKNVPYLQGDLGGEVEQNAMEAEGGTGQMDKSYVNEADISDKPLDYGQGGEMKSNVGLTPQFQKPTTDTTPLGTEVGQKLQDNNLPTNPTTAWYNRLKQWGADTRGVEVGEDGNLTDGNGKTVNGVQFVKDGLKQVLVNPKTSSIDTLPHELYHAFIGDLETSNKPEDRAQVQKLYQLSQPGVDAVNAQRTGQPPVSPHEFVTSEQGLEFLKQQLNLDKESPIKKWWNDTKSIFKSKFSGSATVVDARRFLNYRFVNDRATPIGSTGVPVVNTGAKQNQDNSQLDSTTKAMFDEEMNLRRQMITKHPEYAWNDEDDKIPVDISLTQIWKNHPDDRAIVNKIVNLNIQRVNLRKGFKQGQIHNQEQSQLSPKFIGTQEHPTDPSKNMDLYNLKAPIKDANGNVLHSEGSTVSKSTLDKYGVKYQDNSAIGKPYGAWLDPNGKMIPVKSEYGHEEQARNILGEKHVPSVESHKAQYAYSHDLESKGYSRIFINKDNNTVESDANKPLNGAQRRAVKDYAIEQKMSAKHYTGNGWGKTDFIHDANENFQNKSALPPTKQGEYTEHPSTAATYKLLKVRPQLDQFRKETGDVGEPVAKAIYGTLSDSDHIYGKYNSIVQEGAKGLKNSDINKVENVLIRENRTGQVLRSNLDGRQVKLYDAVRQALLQKQQDQIKSGQQVKDYDSKGKPFLRDAKINPTYYPNKIAPDVIDKLVEHPNSPESRQLKSDFIKHQVSEGNNPEMAKQKLNDMMAAWDSKQSNATRFGANRMTEGVGLPDSWMRPGLQKNLSSYFNRVASDRAYYNNIESKPDVQKLLDPKNEQGVAHEASKMIDDLKGHAFDKEESTIKAANRIATSVMLGSMTSAHIGLSSVATVMQNLKPTEVAQAYTHAITGIGTWYRKAMEQGYARKDLSSVKDLFDAHSTTIEKMNTISSLIGKLNGRQLVDTMTKGFLQGMGDFIVKVRSVEANGGDAGAQAMMKRIDPQWQVGKKYSPAEHDQIASNFANLIHGAHDARTLPEWMLKDSVIKPFFSLMSWSVGQTNHWMKSVWEPATKGNMVPLVMSTLGTIAGGYALQQLRQEISGKRTNIPSLTEIANSRGGLAGNPGLLAYNFMQMASFTGWGGIMSFLGKDAFDLAYKNMTSLSTFPLDETMTETAKTISEGVSAFAQAPNAQSALDIAGRVSVDIARENIQQARIALQWAAKTGMSTENEQYKQKLNSAENDMRNYKMTNQLPYDQQTESNNNPYLNLPQKSFKRTQDIGEAASEVPSLLQTAMQRAQGNPEIMKQQLQSLKQNTYESMPSMPLQMMQYYQYLVRTQGQDVAQQRMRDFMQHQMVNKVKSSLIPTL